MLKLTPKAQDAQFSLVDISSFDLPSFNEPTTPMLVEDLEKFTNATTRAWNKEIAKYQAYIIVSPEYHQGIPGALKNAIDFLYHAWHGKPVMILTYGIFGGAQANRQLRDVLGSAMGMKVVATAPKLDFPGRDELKHNTSPALFQAMSGVVADSTTQYWEGYREEIMNGSEELLELARSS